MKGSVAHDVTNPNLKHQEKPLRLGDAMRHYATLCDASRRYDSLAVVAISYASLSPIQPYRTWAILAPARRETRVNCQVNQRAAMQRDCPHNSWCIILQVVETMVHVSI